MTLSYLSLPCPTQEAPTESVLFGVIPVVARICPTNRQYCTLSLPVSYVVKDQDTGSVGRAVRAKLGSPFILEYAGRECELRVGRRILVRDVS